MRLRYLHLPRCGPLTDARIVFGREDRVTNALQLPRRGTLNFMVGVNGTGKSSLLQALYRIFRSLKLRERPSLPVTIAWDRTTGSKAVTALLHATNRKNMNSFFATLDPVPVSANQADWEEITLAASRREAHPLVSDFVMVTGSDAFSSPFLFAHLPKRLIAYTSGDEQPWMQLEHPIFHPEIFEEGQYQTEDERPQGWDMTQEWEKEQTIRISNLLAPSTLKSSGEAKTFENLRQELSLLQTIRRKALSNRALRSELLDGSYFHVAPSDLRFAGIILALWQTAKELSGCQNERQLEALRNSIIHQPNSDEKPRYARRVLNEIDWLWPTHLSFVYRDAEDEVRPHQHQELLCLVALADEVIAQPLGRCRAVFSLGPSDQINLTQELKNALPFGLPNKGIEAIAERVDGCNTGAEAILRVLSADQDLDSTPMDVFSRLRDWERTGLLEEITLTLKRLHRPASDESDPSEEIIVTYDQLSDGEKMLLCRMGLFFLLRGQEGSLFLLDEPETHFNDIWKREIVEMVDMGLLKSTAANVIVATHTSIALTDAFAAEVTVLDKKAGEITARKVKGGLFGTDPGEVYMNLFGADSSIGRRSVLLLEQLLKTEWKGRANELEEILEILGSSFHRAELRAVLRQLRATSHGAPPR